MNVIDKKRAWLASITLAHFRHWSVQELAQHIRNLNRNVFSIDDLLCLQECIPTPEEAALLRSYQGDRSLLSVVSNSHHVVMVILQKCLHIICFHAHDIMAIGGEVYVGDNGSA